MGTRDDHHKAHGKYTEPWDVQHAERHLMAKIYEQLIDTVNATGGYEIEGAVDPVQDCRKSALLPPKRAGVKAFGFLKFAVGGEFTKLGRTFYANLEGTRKPLALGAATALGPRNSVVVLTLPLLELSLGFQEAA